MALSAKATAAAKATAEAMAAAADTEAASQATAAAVATPEEEVDDESIDNIRCPLPSTQHHFHPISQAMC